MSDLVEDHARLLRAKRDNLGLRLRLQSEAVRKRLSGHVPAAGEDASFLIRKRRMGTAHGGKGSDFEYVRLAPDGEVMKAWHISTTLEALDGWEEQMGDNRPTGAAYSRDYWSDHHYPKSSGRGRFWWCGLVLMMGLVLLEANGLHFLIAWELFTLCGYMLITLENRGRKVRGA